jgi:hypothetical protein
MRKITTAVLTGSTLLLLIGCTNNTPDISQYQHSQKVIYTNGKKYMIPRNSDKDFVVSKEQEKMFKKMQVSCRQGDIHWSSKKARDVMKSLDKKASKEHSQAKLAYHGIKGLHGYKLMGCAKVMTSKQKKAYLRESDRKLAMINQRIRYMEAKKPIKYEVHHTGEVDVYLYD